MCKLYANTKTFYMRELSVHRFWCPRGNPETIPPCILRNDCNVPFGISGLTSLAYFKEILSTFFGRYMIKYLIFEFLTKNLL